MIDRELLRKQIRNEYVSIQKLYEKNPSVDNFKKREDVWNRAKSLRFDIIRTWDKDYKMLECYVKDVL